MSVKQFWFMPCCCYVIDQIFFILWCDSIIHPFFYAIKMLILLVIYGANIRLFMNFVGAMFEHSRNDSIGNLFILLEKCQQVNKLESLQSSYGCSCVCMVTARIKMSIYLYKRIEQKHTYRHFQNNHPTICSCYKFSDNSTCHVQ